MAYTLTPNATDKVSATQSPIRTNFVEIQTIIGANHVTFTGSAGDQGKHKYVEFVNTAAPAVGAATQMTLYTATTDTYPHLYYKNSSFSFDMQSATVGSAGGLSEVTFNMPNLFTGDAANWQMKTVFTTATLASGSNHTITYPVAFTTASLPPTVTPIYSSASATQQVICTVKSYTASGCVVRIDSIGSVAAGNTHLTISVIGR